MGFSFNTPQPNYQQPQVQVQQQPTNQGLLGFGNISLNTKPVTNTNTNQFTFNSAKTSNDEFGGFD